MTVAAAATAAEKQEYRTDHSSLPVDGTADVQIRCWYVRYDRMWRDPARATAWGIGRWGWLGWLRRTFFTFARPLWAGCVRSKLTFLFLVAGVVSRAVMLARLVVLTRTMVFVGFMPSRCSVRRANVLTLLRTGRTLSFAAYELHGIARVVSRTLVLARLVALARAMPW
jgi:hypothetical protein